MKRLELCDDPAAKEYLRYTTAQMMNGNFNYQIMFEGWVLPQQRAQQCVLLILLCRGLILVLDRHDDDKCKLSRPEEGYASCILISWCVPCLAAGCARACSRTGCHPTLLSLHGVFFCCFPHDNTLTMLLLVPWLAAVCVRACSRTVAQLLLIS